MSKNRHNALGRSLIKDRFGNKRNRNTSSFLHTSELKDGYDWNRLNLQSVTEENSFQEFLNTAELAGTEFTAEKLNVSYVDRSPYVGLFKDEERGKVSEIHRLNKDVLKIPRRPKWDATTTGEELQQKERDHFLEWRRTLAVFQEQRGLLMTPYEKNLDLWRQLWRVVERSDVLVQIVDARNPLLYRCKDLEAYVKEVDEKKRNLIICNKAEFLTPAQRKKWAKYFDSINVSVVFFSATSWETDSNSEKVEEQSVEEESSDEEGNICLDEVHCNDEDFTTDEEEEIVGLHSPYSVTYYYENRAEKNSSKLLTSEELIEHFRSYISRGFVSTNIVTIGLVGYPNVGKSSTINALLTQKKVPVSATPGKTKHFQTLFLDKNIILCDCPGLVMPSFVFTKADMILNGILPIDQMRDHISPVQLLCALVPRHVFEELYGIMIPKPSSEEDQHRIPLAEELLSTYAYYRGFMTSHGQPDNSRAARIILKHFVSGKILYCHAPPDTDQDEFHKFSEAKNEHKPQSYQTTRIARGQRYGSSVEAVEERFFKLLESSIHKKPANTGMEGNKSTTKPWKDHKDKRNTKVKSRVKYHHLDY